MRMFYGPVGYGDGSVPRLQCHVAYHRGMKWVECRAENVWLASHDIDGPDAHGPIPGTNRTRMLPNTWRPTPWALAVCRSHLDVVEMWMTDYSPNTETIKGKASWYFTEGSQNPEYPHWIPSFLVDDMQAVAADAEWSRHWNEPRVAVVEFNTERGARTALARAIVRWIHSYDRSKS